MCRNQFWLDDKKTLNEDAKCTFRKKKGKCL